MKINSFIGIDNLFFIDNFKTISNKLKGFKMGKGERMFMDKVNLTLFVNELNQMDIDLSTLSCAQNNIKKQCGMPVFYA